MLGQLSTKRMYKIKEIYNIYKNPSPYINVLQVLQLQCLHFVDFRCFLKALKETEFQFLMVILPMAHEPCPFERIMTNEHQVLMSE